MHFLAGEEGWNLKNLYDIWKGKWTSETETFAERKIRA